MTTYMCTRTHICVHMYSTICTQICVRIYVYMYVYTYICTQIYVRLHIFGYICIRRYVYRMYFHVSSPCISEYSHIMYGDSGHCQWNSTWPPTYAQVHIYVYVYIFTYVYRVYTYIILPYISEYLHIMYRNSDQQIFTYYVQEFRSLSVEQYMAIYLCTYTYKSVHICIYICLPCIYLHIFTIYQRIFITYYVRAFRPLSID